MFLFSFLFFIAYQAIQILAIPVFIVYLVSRVIKKKPVFGVLCERLGYVPKAQKRNKNIIWLHAVSVGEVLSLQALVNKIKKDAPSTICYLTVGTSTGKKIAQQNLAVDHISFFPYDFLPCMYLAYKRINPSKLIIVEAEIWPNFLMLSKIKKIPTYLINARISARSKKSYHRLKVLLLPLLKIFKTIYTQSEYDKQEFEKLGLEPANIKVLGNIKAYNVLEKYKKLYGTNKKEIKEKIKKEKEETLLVGSMHPGELAYYLELYKKLKPKNKNLKLIIAPRHFYWKEKLIEKVKKTGFSFYVWDETTKNKVLEKRDSYEILLVCKLGELFHLYQNATIFYLGGTFVPVGGHNLLEPAVWATPTIIGPHYQNNTIIARELLNKKALLVAKNQQELIENTQNLLDDLERRQEMGNNMRSWLEQESKSVKLGLGDLMGKLMK